MALDPNFGFYSDAALTIPLPDITFVQAVDNSLPLVNKRVFLGNPTPDLEYQASSGPGSVQIEVSLADAFPAFELDTDDVKLALTEVGLITATPGASLDVGLSILSGPGNGAEIWITVLDLVLTQGTYTIQLETNELAEF